MNDAFITINGKQTQLTDEQLKQLGLYEEESPFVRHEGQTYLYISTTGKVSSERDVGYSYTKAHFDLANYCTDRNLLQQRAYHETLSRRLWRYSCEHPENKDGTGWVIYYAPEASGEKFGLSLYNVTNIQGSVRFNTKEIAQSAIEEVVLPFINSYPDFDCKKWF